MVPHLLIRYFFTDLMRCRKSTIAHLLVTAPQAAGLLGQVGTTRTLPASPPPAHKRCRFAIEFYLSHSPPPQAVGQPTTSRTKVVISRGRPPARCSPNTTPSPGHSLQRSTPLGRSLEI